MRKIKGVVQTDIASRGDLDKMPLAQAAAGASTAGNDR
jgi:hypothetical protein